MASEQGSSGVAPWMLYSSLSTVFLSMLLVFNARNSAVLTFEWILLEVYLLGMALFFTVMTINARRAEK